MTLPHYQRGQTYRWNFDNAPDPDPHGVSEIPGDWTFCGLPVGSPLGIPAGPLLNGKWVLYYASLGFDVLTYKTVRSSERACYELPNLLPVETTMLNGDEDRLPASQEMEGSWAVSFGMPSSSPEFWRADVEWTRSQLPTEKLLSVSVVGSVQPGWTTEDLATDYATCAKWAVESGADCVELNLSCPNVETCDGQLYQQPAEAKIVAEVVRDAIGDSPLVLKIGHVTVEEDATELLTAVAPSVDALAMTNSVAARVEGASGVEFFGGAKRGICGKATLQASIRQTAMFHRLIEESGMDLRLIGVGGASTAEDVLTYLEAGAESVHLATAVMVNPLVGCEIRNSWC